MASPKPVPSGARGALIVGLVKLLEDPWQLFRRNSGAGVVDAIIATPGPAGRNVSSTTPPCGVNLNALDSRLPSDFVHPIEVPEYLVRESNSPLHAKLDFALHREHVERALELAQQVVEVESVRGSRRPPPASNRLTSSNCFTRRSSVFA